MQIKPINNLKYTSEFSQPKILQNQTNIQPLKQEITYSLWDCPQISFGSAKRTYSSEIPGATEKPGKFKIGTIPNLTCPACGQKILTRNQYKEFLRTIRKADEKDYLSILIGYEKYMCPVERNVFNLIKQEYEENSETTDLKVIANKLRDKMLPELEEIQLAKLNEMRAAADKLPTNERETVKKTLQAFEIIIKDENKKAPFRRKTLLEETANFKIRNQKSKQELMKIAESFPSSTENVCAWIVKNAGLDKNGNERSSLELAEKLVNEASTSTDHILARNIELNHDDPTNYMSMHRRCNSEKGDKAFLDWYYEDPENRAQYIRTYLEEVDGIMQSGKIKDKKYKNYIKDCVNTMYRLSDGKVNFKRQFLPEEK